MVNKDKLEYIDEQLVLKLFNQHLQNTTQKNVIWTLPYLYELSMILLCKKAGLENISDKYCLTNYTGWRLFTRVRNVCSHTMYNSESIKQSLSMLIQKDILFNVMKDLGISTNQYMQLYYSMIFLLRKENIYE